ncbi:hypothetical protein [Streptomyces sp. H39-S7]|uniref:hypothetical protein n=1 Tax=Streptomyces sp. H39-S7 TaxID=3004357 RepID=UPI0022AF0118|nr:hypothetical protein [Streptomyces sp. H39-S7]MCZ4124767.1 hypothetical protein [Streptomyces sp. H39-S7]
MSAFPGAPDVAGREYTLKAVAGLAQRAKDAGHLRSDFVLDDLILILMANKGIHTRSTDTQVKASRRFAGLAIQAFEACSQHAALPLAARLLSEVPHSA